jgi:hypothetical protein
MIRSSLNLYGSIPRSLLRSLVTQYPAACCGVVYSSPDRVYWEFREINHKLAQFLTKVRHSPPASV